MLVQKVGLQTFCAQSGGGGCLVAVAALLHSQTTPLMVVVCSISDRISTIHTLQSFF